MVQEIIIGILFTAALFFLGKIVYKTFNQKENCSAGCSCSSVSIQDIENKIKTDKRFEKK